MAAPGAHARTKRATRTTALRALLQPLFAAENESCAFKSPDDFNAAVTTLLTLAAQYDSLVTAAFAASANAAAAADALKAPSFWQSLRQAEALAAWLAQRE